MNSCINCGRQPERLPDLGRQHSFLYHCPTCSPVMLGEARFHRTHGGSVHAWNCANSPPTPKLREDLEEARKEIGRLKAALSVALDDNDDLRKVIGEQAEVAAELAIERDHLSALVALAESWLRAYDDTGPDNGPNLIEHDCAEALRSALAAGKGTP